MGSPKLGLVRVNRFLRRLTVVGERVEGKSSNRLLGVAYYSPISESQAWSGIPAGVMRGLQENGMQAQAINMELPRVVRAAFAGAGMVVHRDREPGKLSALAARSRTALAAVRHRRTLDEAEAFVQLGSTFRLPDGTRYVTLDDMTLAQAMRDPEWRYQLHPMTISAWRRRQTKIFEQAVTCCTASSWTAESIIKDYDVDPAKVHVVGLGRNLDARPVEKDWSVPRFLFIGREWERKSGPAVLRSFALLRADVPAARLDVVGNHPPIDQGGVTTHGQLRVNDPSGTATLHRLLENATCLVLPSKSEPFGIVYAEAAAAGIASIGTTVGGAAEVIGAGGVVVDPHDESALTKAMAELADPTTAARLGSLALAASARFTWVGVARRLVGALDAAR